jgi:Ca-activated chloride channel family protein
MRWNPLKYILERSMNLLFINRKAAYVLSLTLLICFSPLTSSIAEDSNSRSILVLDASGSMWGQIDGKTKIEIAREAVQSMVANWSESNELGLIAYGHREKGSCDDIEIILQPGAVDSARFTSIVQGISPKGKTPLTAAVRLAAEELRYTEEKATVILLSDGVETCDLDPCAVGAELEKLGVDFTAHVVGFDVNSIEEQAGLRCLAENTGGMFIAAKDAAELQAALAKTAAPTPEPSPSPSPSPSPTPLPQARILAPQAGLAGTEVSIDFDAPIGVDGYLYLSVPGKDRSITYVTVRSSDGIKYDTANLVLPAQTGSYELTWKTGSDQVLASTTIEALEAQVSLSAPSRATAGTEINVQISAPPGMHGYIYLYAKDRDQSVAYAPVRPAQDEGYETAALRLPATVGTYRITFEGGDKDLYAETTVDVEAAAINLKAPESVSAGTYVPIEFEGPTGLAGYVYLYAEGRERSIHYDKLQENQSRGGYEPMKIQVPATAGTYVLKYETGDNEVLAETTFVATAANAALEHDSLRPAGTMVHVTPQGPDGLEGYVYLHAVGREKSITYAKVSEASIKGYSKLTLKLPATPGEYELLWKTRADEVLVTSRLTIEPAEIVINAPQQLVVGRSSQFVLNAPDGIDGYLYIYPAGSEKSLSYHKVTPGRLAAYDPVPFTGPEQAGQYTVKWITSLKEEVASVDFEVVAQN